MHKRKCISSVIFKMGIILSAYVTIYWEIVDLKHVLNIIWNMCLVVFICVSGYECLFPGNAIVLNFLIKQLLLKLIFSCAWMRSYCLYFLAALSHARIILCVWCYHNMWEGISFPVNIPTAHRVFVLVKRICLGVTFKHSHFDNALVVWKC